MPIDSTTFERVRRSVLKEVASGFDADGGTHRRQVAEGQLHCFEFGVHKRGGAFCVDMGFHFASVPSFESFSASAKLKHPQPDSCWLHRRWRSEENRQFVDYGETLEDAERNLRKIVSDTLRFLDEVERLVGDGSKLLDLLPPERLRGDAEIFQKFMACPDLEQRDRISDSMTIRKLFPGWLPHVSPTCILLAYLSRKFGRHSLVAEYLAVTQLPGQGHIMLPKTRGLIEPLMKVRDE